MNKTTFHNLHQNEVTIEINNSAELNFDYSTIDTLNIKYDGSSKDVIIDFIKYVEKNSFTNSQTKNSKFSNVKNINIECTSGVEISKSMENLSYFLKERLEDESPKYLKNLKYFTIKILKTPDENMNSLVSRSFYMRPTRAMNEEKTYVDTFYRLMGW